MPKTLNTPQPALNHPWDRAAATVLTRINGAFDVPESIDPGAKFFVLALEALGARTRFSCEGHPTDFYVAFDAPYELALEISNAGYFSVEIEGPNYWSIRRTHTERGIVGYSEADKVLGLRLAAEAWVDIFGVRLAGMDCLKPTSAVNA